MIPYNEQTVKSYLSALPLEWNLRKNSIDSISSLYLGGGTPSLLSPKEIESILHLFPPINGEITLEANPENITLEKMKAYRDLGINRISIGVQSLDDSLLQVIDRRHTAKRSLDAIEATYKAGFDNISIDLMYDLPTQTPATFRRSLLEATKLPITHLSLYNLSFEIGSLYYKKEKELTPLLPNEEQSLEMIEDAAAILESGGLKRYEISAFARDNKISVHNTGYWVGRPFIGLGPSAFSYTYGKRHQNCKQIHKWASFLQEGKDPTDFEEALPYPSNLLELFAVRLRLLEGAYIDDFPPLPEDTHKTLKNLLQEGYLFSKYPGHFALTYKGTLFYDFIASELI